MNNISQRSKWLRCLVAGMGTLEVEEWWKAQVLQDRDKTVEEAQEEIERERGEKDDE